MKSVNKYILGLTGLLSLGILVVSCEKTFDEKISLNTDLNNSTVAQIYVATIGATRNYVYVNNKPVNGAALSLGSVFPIIGYGFNVNSGVQNFLVADTQVVKIPVTTQLPLSFAENMQVGKKHTIFLYDTITSPKQKTVVTDIVIPGDTTARLRFANFIYSKNAVPAIDIFSKRQNTNVFTNVPTTSVSNFVVFPSGLTDTFFVRETGTLNQLGVLNSVTPTQKRSYTLVLRGHYLITAGTNARTLALMVDR